MSSTDTAWSPGQPALDLSEHALDQRIEALRKGNCTVVLRDHDGRPVTGEVSFELVRHTFPFGTAVAAPPLLADPAQDADARQYQEVLRAHFNCAVAENAHKWYAMEKEQGQLKDAEALAVWHKCRELGLAMRGHCIFWGIDQYVQPWIKALPTEELVPTLRRRLRHVLALFAGKITEWDLNNEMMHGDYYAETLGWADGSPYFQWAHEAAPEVRFFVNDYGVLESHGVDRYVAHIRALQQAGARIDGIGDQAHFDCVPPNAHLWDVLDKLGQFGLPVKITEFDINTTDEAAQAADTRRFYKLCFAHPAVHGILMWGFWEGRHWRPNAALWRKDWTLKPNGQAYLQLMEAWRTHGTASADAHGRLTFRGFYGDYHLRAGALRWHVSLTKDGQATEIMPESPGAK